MKWDWMDWIDESFIYQMELNGVMRNWTETDWIQAKSICRLKSINSNLFNSGIESIFINEFS